MTTFFDEAMKCSCCGHNFEVTALGSSNAFGPDDLDTRPPEMLRSTMMHWIHICPECGFVNLRHEEDNSDMLKYMRSDDYRTCEGYRLEGLAAGFYRRGLIETEKNDPDSAMMSFLRAAWCSDDMGDDEKADICRDRAVTAAEDIESPDCEQLLILADMYRRMGRFFEFTDMYPDLSFSDENMQTILEAQKKLADTHDYGCHNVGEFIK